MPVALLPRLEGTAGSPFAGFRDSLAPRRSPPPPEHVIARKRSPETFEKRRRAFDKQRKREQKLADRVARNAAKRSGESPDDDPPNEDPETEAREPD